MYALIACALALSLFTGCVVIANRFHKPAAFEEVKYARPAVSRPVAAGALSVATWNIGYAGMGKEADFVMDLGKQKRPVSASLVERNMAEIAKQAASLDVDVLFVQEAARPSWNTYHRDVLRAIEDRLPSYGMTFGADIKTRFVPLLFRIEIGNAIFSRVAVEMAERRGLPLEPTFEYGLFRKGYRMHILRLRGRVNWVLINIHLSTFDSEEDNVRERQLASVLAFAESEYKRGHHVVVGGDWNFRLEPIEFPHTTEKKYLFWIRDLPHKLTPKGWRWGIDPSIATVRTAHKPYVEGENYRLIVDGFLVSPNVSIASIEAMDLGFVHTDHNPVKIHFRVRDTPHQR